MSTTSQLPTYHDDTHHPSATIAGSSSKGPLQSITIETTTVAVPAPAPYMGGSTGGGSGAYGSGHVPQAGAPPRAEDGKIQGVGPTEGDDALQNDDDEDVWEGGIVSYHDSSNRKRRKPSQKFADRICGFRDFRRPMIWRAAAVELVGTMLWVMFLASITISFYGARTERLEYTGITPGLLTGLLHILVLPMLMFATTAASGGHLNPGITLATFFAGFTKFSRALLYILAQMIGGILGCAIIWGWLSSVQNDFYGAGNCDRGGMSMGRALLMESSCYFWFLFVVFGVAFDPAQRRIFGPVLAPFFLAAILGTVVILSSHVGNYQGVWINPARCFGAAVISGRFSAEVWISIVSAIIAAAGIALLYLIIPFNHEFRSRNKARNQKLAGNMPQHQQQYNQRAPHAIV